MPDFNDSPSIAAAVEAAKARGEMPQEQPAIEIAAEQPAAQEDEPTKDQPEEV